MSVAWNKVVGFLGMNNDHDEHYDHGSDVEDEFDDHEDSKVRKIGRRDRTSRIDGYSDRSERTQAGRREHNLVVYESTQSRVHIAKPKKFEDVQKFTKIFKNNVPVILNLDPLTPELTRRIFDFSMGLVFGLDGQLEGVGEKVFLMTPKNVNISAEERKRWQENGIFDLDKLRKKFTDAT